MARIDVRAGRTLLEGYVKSTAVGICELVWNAFDEDATKVAIRVQTNGLGGVDLVEIEDNGNGMAAERAESAFSKVGDSWKLPSGTKSDGGRPVHGKHGRGRYAAFSIGSSVRWVSTSEAVEGGELRTISIAGTRPGLEHFEIDVIPREGREKGTVVSIGLVSPEAAQLFDERLALRDRLLTEFALHLERYPDFEISFLGSPINPAEVLSARKTIELELPPEIDGRGVLTVLEWTLSNVERRLYLCGPNGSIVGELQPNIHAVGAEFTAYVEWPGFVHDQELLLHEDTQTPAGVVVQAARQALRSHLAESARRREAQTIERWKAEGVYPYMNEPRSSVEKATRDTFNVVAMAAARTVDEARSQTSKGLSLSLLRETFERDPEALLPIMRQFSKLPNARIEELREVLEHTTLSQLITLGKAVGDRIEFLNGLNAILFDKMTKKRLLERRQLHRILAHETWIFGEEWSLTGDDDRLRVVLRNFLSFLGQNVELADEKDVLRTDGTIAIPDLVLGRRLETNENRFSHLVVELKRPSHRLTDGDVSQLRSYASAITKDERFDQPNSTWEFWLIGNETEPEVDDQRTQDQYPYGVVQRGKKYTLVVKTWAEIIGDAEHRMKFVSSSLQYESDRDSGLAALRSRYAEYLPVEDASYQVARTAEQAEGAGAPPSLASRRGTPSCGP